MMSSITYSIFKKELKSYLSTPLGYVFLTIFLFAIGYVTFEPGRGSFFLLRQADLSSFFSLHPLAFYIFDSCHHHEKLGRGEKIRHH